MGTIGFDKTGRLGLSFLIGFMIAGSLFGCAVTEHKHLEESNVKGVDDGENRWDVPSYEDILMELATESKPTKIISVQMGQREVYAPERDPIVRSKFESFARKADYCVEHKEDADCKYLVAARDLQMKSYLRAGCSSVVISSCGPYGLTCSDDDCKARSLGHQVRSKSPKAFTPEEDNRFRAFLHPEAIDAAICPINMQTHLSTLSAVIDIENGKTLDEQIQYFFKIQCNPQ